MLVPEEDHFGIGEDQDEKKFAGLARVLVLFVWVEVVGEEHNSGGKKLCEIGAGLGTICSVEAVMRSTNSSGTGIEPILRYSNQILNLYVIKKRMPFSKAS